jgi:hypothetical protein
VVIPFFAFRIMVGMGLVMLAVSWFCNWLRFRGRLRTTRWFLWCTFLAFPTGFVAVLTISRSASACARERYLRVAISEAVARRSICPSAGQGVGGRNFFVPTA